MIPWSEENDQFPCFPRDPFKGLERVAYDFTRRSNDLGFTPTPLPCAAAVVPPVWQDDPRDPVEDDENPHPLDNGWPGEGCLSSAVCWIVAIVALIALVAFVCGVGEPSLKAMDQEQSRTMTVGMETRR